MFSSTTMASSTSRPTERDNASRVSELSVKPAALMKAKVPMTEVGMAMAAIRVMRRLRRKTAMITTARMPPSRRSNIESSTEALMNVDSSAITSTSTPGGARRRIFGSAAMTFAAISTVLVPDCLRITTVSAFRPLTVAREVSSAMPSTTVATSERRTTAPMKFMTITARSSSSDATEPLVFRLMSWSPAGRLPAGISRFCTPSAVATSIIVMLCRRRASGSGRTQITRSR